MQFILTVGATRTARIDGISAAGAAPELLAHTPVADTELLVHGEIRDAPALPVSPTGCPTPAVVTRAGRDLLGFDVDVVDAGVAAGTSLGDLATVTLPGGPGEDVREPEAVPNAAERFAAGRAYGRSLSDDRIVLAETIPGGTTTAMSTLAALGERPAVSSSLPDNPLEQKRTVVAAGLDAAGLAPGDAADDPIEALRAVGDPVLAGVAGITVGALESGTSVTLAGGTQMSAAAALVRGFGVDAPIRQATTSFVGGDETADVRGLAADLDVDLTVTDPRFDAVAHPMTDAYCRGEAKEGVGMGGVLSLAARESGTDGVVDLRDRAISLYDTLVDAPADVGW